MRFTIGRRRIKLLGLPQPSVGVKWKTKEEKSVKVLAAQWIRWQGKPCTQQLCVDAGVGACFAPVVQWGEAWVELLDDRHMHSAHVLSSAQPCSEHCCCRRCNTDVCQLELTTKCVCNPTDWNWTHQVSRPLSGATAPKRLQQPTVEGVRDP